MYVVACEYATILLYIYSLYNYTNHGETTHVTVYILLLPGLMDGGMVKPPMGLDVILRLVGTIEVGDLHACIQRIDDTAQDKLVYQAISSTMRCVM